MMLVKKLKKLINNMDKPLLFSTVFLFLFGLLNIVTASSREAVSYDVSIYHYFFQQSKMLLIGLAISLFIINFDTKKYKSLITVVGYLIILSFLIYLSLHGIANRGAKNWINFLGFTFQPSEFAKPILIVSLSVLFEVFLRKFRNPKINHYTLIGIILFIGLMFSVIVFTQKDFGTMLILTGIFGVMFLASPILKKDKFNTILFLSFTLIFCLLLYTSISDKKIFTEEQLSRFDFFNPCASYETGGYQVCNAFIAINNGGFNGLGIGKSKQKYSYIPEPHTDSVFAIFIEEWGLLAGLFVILLYIFILKRISNISSNASTIRGKFMGLGVLVYMALHIFINLGGLFGLIPLTGVPLPFLSYGGSFTISFMCALALVQRICIETKIQKITVGGNL